jgi:hypothetical protein
MGCISSVLPRVQSYVSNTTVSRLGFRFIRCLWHDALVPDESHSERLRRESKQLLVTAAKLIDHAASLKEQAAELQKQIARLEHEASKQNRKKA